MSCLGGKRIWCNARTSATGFYEKFGFQSKDEYFSEQGVDFVIMELHLEPAFDA